MTFVSYAQNFEDVLLWRALGHIKNGFYIDVGANSPVEQSVTKAFYDAGWSGINIEPMPSFVMTFQEHRPRDINLAVAAGANEGEITLFDIPQMNGWATVDVEVARAHQADGYALTEIKVPLRTLSAICAQHVHGPIHFLKIDVEGFEGEVLRGMDFAKWRPWVVVVEATKPGSRVSNHETWEALVTAAGYHYAYFDGLNRYYVALEHAELLPALTIQPNVFDDFISHQVYQARSRVNELEQADQARSRVRELEQQAREMAGTIEQLGRQLVELDAHIRRVEGELESARNQILQTEARLQQSTELANGLEQQLQAIYSSKSWRFVSLLRTITRRDARPAKLVK